MTRSSLEQLVQRLGLSESLLVHLLHSEQKRFADMALCDYKGEKCRVSGATRIALRGRRGLEALWEFLPGTLCKGQGKAQHLNRMKAEWIT